jgi:hypothetical protein
MPLPLSFMVLDDERQAEVLESRKAFTDMTRMETKHWPASQAALLVKDDEDGVTWITEVGSVTRSRHRIATGWHRLRYIRRLQITPVALDALLAKLPARHREFVRARALSGGVLTEKSAAAVVAALNDLARGAADELMRDEPRRLGRAAADGRRTAGGGAGGRRRPPGARHCRPSPPT